MNNSVLFLSVIALSSMAGCASQALPATRSADAVEPPPGSVTVEFTERARPSVPHDVPATSVPTNRHFTCLYVIPETGESFATRNAALDAGAHAGLTRFTVAERCSSDWKLALLDGR